MLTYTGLRNLYGDLTSNSTTSNLALGDRLMNLATRHVLTSAKWPFRTRQFTKTTVASQEFYQLPAYLDKVLTCKVAIGTTKYAAKECPDMETWDRLTESPMTSDIPEYYMLLDGRIGIYPTPASGGNTITVSGRLSIKDLSIADYTTGTITTLAAGGTTVTGSGTSWTSAMAGRWIKIDEPTGDGFWYEISSVTDATHLELVKPYSGAAIAAGSGAYAIGQTSQLPEDHQDLPAYQAARTYFSTIQPDAGRAAEMLGYVKDGLDRLSSDWKSQSDSVVINEADGRQDNPNDYIWAV